MNREVKYPYYGCQHYYCRVCIIQKLVKQWLDELVKFFVELCGAVGESVEKKDVATAAGRDALLKRVKASADA